MQVLDQDRSATLSQAFEPATEPPRLPLLMRLHEWFAFKPAPSKVIIVVATSVAPTCIAASMIPTMILSIVIFHLLIFTVEVGFIFLDAFLQEMLVVSSLLFLISYHVV